MQDDLFSGRRWLERRTAVGSVVRVLLEPLPGERVRIITYQARRGAAGGFVRRRQFEGQVAAFAQVAPGVGYREFFGLE